MEQIREMLKAPKARGHVALGGVHLYLRVTRRVDPNSNSFHDTLEIASVEVEERGRGAFSRFLVRLLKELGRVLYVENVMEERFQAYWERLGAVSDRRHDPPSYWLHPDQFPRAIQILEECYISRLQEESV